MDQVSYFVEKKLKQGMFISAIVPGKPGLSTPDKKPTILQIFSYNKQLFLNSLGWEEYINEEVKSFTQLILDTFIDDKEWESRVVPMTLLSVYIESNDFKKIQVKNLLKLK